MLGLPATATIRRTLSERRRQTLGACTILMGTSGSGVATGMVIIPKVRLAIPLEYVRARAACSVAVVGTSRPRIVGRRPGSGARRASASTTAAASELP